MNSINKGLCRSRVLGIGRPELSPFSEPFRTCESVFLGPSESWQAFIQLLKDYLLICAQNQQPEQLDHEG